LKLVAEGRPNKSIAEYLCLSVKTVEKHRSNLMKKLDLHNASMLTAFAIAKGLVVSDSGPPQSGDRFAIAPRGASSA
jgi:DNA-binding NarL/FixJ family response regulator